MKQSRTMNRALYCQHVLVVCNTLLPTYSESGHSDTVGEITATTSFCIRSGTFFFVSN